MENRPKNRYFNIYTCECMGVWDGLCFGCEWVVCVCGGVGGLCFGCEWMGDEWILTCTCVDVGVA